VKREQWERFVEGVERPGSENETPNRMFTLAGITCFKPYRNKLKQH